MNKAYEHALLSDVGRVREKNEDSAVAIPEHSLFVVADGMGGHNRGDVASEICVESIRECYLDTRLMAEWKKMHRQHLLEVKTGTVRRTFHEYRVFKAVEDANRQIYTTANQHAHLKDMGTTVVATAFTPSRVYVATVGDSRVYRIRESDITQLTEDHSLANEYIKMKILRKEDLPRFPFKNIIVRALGLSEYVKVDTLYRSTKPGDIYLLCSDGLTDLIPDERILELVESSDSLESACKNLVDAANAAGGVDNTTVLLVRTT